MTQKFYSISQVLEKGYKIYIAAQPMIFKDLTINEKLKPYILFFDCLLEENRNWYKDKALELNIRVFGKQSMPSEPWVDHHFGIACGVTLGFLNPSGEPISMGRFIKKFEENSIHEWTLLVDPKYEGRHLGKATVALECEFSKNKERISTTTQLNNRSIALYLGLTKEGNPLELLAVGFHHTYPNSILAIADIPKDSNSIMQNYNMPSIDEGILISEKTELKKGRKYLIQASNLNTIKRISQDLKKGAKYNVIGWYDENSTKGMSKEPLTMIEKIG